MGLAEKGQTEDALYKRWSLIAAALLALWPPLAGAQLSIEITGAGAQRIPVAIVPFAGEAALPPGLS
ncbi:MAG TPA: hypothetical protein VEL04_01270, partial [Burkholderiales bacterium]|nr:hypothetical protein [Burkholderiales bacterium]